MRPLAALLLGCSISFAACSTGGDAPTSTKLPDPSIGGSGGASGAMGGGTGAGAGGGATAGFSGGGGTTIAGASGSTAGASGLSTAGAAGLGGGAGTGTAAGGSGGKPGLAGMELLFDGQHAPFNLRIDGDHLLWTGTSEGSPYSVHRMRKDGSEHEELTETAGIGYFCFAFDDQNIYWADDVPSDQKAVLHALPKTGTGKVDLGTLEGQCVHMTVDEQAIYGRLHNGDAIWRMPKVGGAPEPIASSPLSPPRAVAADEAYVFWTSSGGQDGVPWLMRWSKEQPMSEPVPLALDVIGRGSALLLDGSFAYAIVSAPSSNDRIIRVAKDGGSAGIVLYDVETPFGLQDLVKDSRYLFTQRSGPSDSMDIVGVPLQGQPPWSGHIGDTTSDVISTIAVDDAFLYYGRMCAWGTCPPKEMGLGGIWRVPKPTE
jgi:hypothetical protein